jgi:beta-carotene 3-hydroxylase
MLGMMWSVPESTAFGFGIAAYGLTYFLVHEIFIHQRFRWWVHTDNPYFRAVRLKHKWHHKTLGKEGSAHFGLLWVPWSMVREEARKMKLERQS